MSKTDSTPVEPKEPPPTATGYGFDEKGFFRILIHESRGICELLGFLEQMKDVVKSYYTHKEMQKQQNDVKNKIIMPGIHKAQKGLRPH